jgi:UDP-N-acetylmuramoyl-L-alanyl-D-glutamate--2,6-diaminopimelate ligase
MMAVRHLQRGYPLAALLEGFAAAAAQPDLAVTGLATDSRQVRPGDLFLAVAGQQHHGLDHARDAVAAGAVAVLWEPQAGHPELEEMAAAIAVPAIAMPGLRLRLGLIASRFYGAPSRDLFVVGVTGTDGKTSCSHFLAEAFSEPGCPGALLGTLGYGPFGQLKPATHTTPDALVIQRELAELRAAGLRRVAMEASSHGLHQGRVIGVNFDVAVFTNLSRDHLDYHGDLAAYGAAKRLLFQAPDLQAAVINGGDPFGRELLGQLSSGLRAIAYGLEEELAGLQGVEQVSGHALRLDDHGLSLRVRSPWGEGELRAGLLGAFNASNLLAVLAVLGIAGMPLQEILARLSRVHTVPGRMERFGGGAGQALVVVDYAHTPRALEQVLLALRGHCRGTLYCVFGAGGDRDRGKRPLMGAVAERLADRVLLTNDNPRSEAPEAILAEIRAGMTRPDVATLVPDRALAIRQAIAQASPGDLVLVAGKGHEEYQQIGAERRPFSDRAQVLAALAGGAA